VGVTGYVGKLYVKLRYERAGLDPLVRKNRGGIRCAVHLVSRGDYQWLERMVMTMSGGVLLLSGLFRSERKRGAVRRCVCVI